MAVWVVRGGKHGEFEEEALERGMLTIGWSELREDLSGVAD
jgi:predicted Mrr-cat superfamily restriction endonuclease